MRKFIFIVILMFCATLFLISCGTQKPQIMYKDSIQTRVEKYTEYVHDTVKVDIPAQSAEVTTVDSFSHLETDFAISDARINSNGTLFHNLLNKPQTIEKPFEKPIEHNDSVRIEYIDRYYPSNIEYREKELTSWQEFRLDAFPWFVLAVLSLAGWIFRKPLGSLLNLLLSLIKKI